MVEIATRVLDHPWLGASGALCDGPVPSDSGGCAGSSRRFHSSPEVFANLARVIERQDDVILGRGTYDYWANYWPRSDVEPFATFINSTTKHIATSRDLDTTWANSVMTEGRLDEYVGALKCGTGGDIGVPLERSDIGTVMETSC